ncbi:PAS domain-containing protein [Maribacter halichondriae]|uniref:PAS domain-containing protein n=1 Tax=Maribacter halichondriae TaxID=2980554 RepID=UPI002358750B|nr:PAS domain-containing protein [Maribacter sp. Hal144]
MKVRNIHTNNYLIKQLPKATAFVNTKYEIVYASDRWIADFELDGSTVFGTSIFSRFDINCEDWKNSLKKCVKGTPGKVIVNYPIEEKWLEWLNTPWYDENENVIGAIIQVEDVTSRNSNNVRLEKLEELINDKSEGTKIGTWEFDHTTKKLRWCPIVRDIHEVSDTFVPTLENAIEFYSQGYSRNAISIAVDNAIANREPWNEKLEIITAKGNHRWVIAAGKPIYDHDEFIGLIGSFQDITHQVLSEERSSENHGLLQTLIDSLPLNVYIKDRESRKILVNKSESDYAGLGGPEKLLGKDDFDVYDKKTAEMSRKEDLMVMNSGIPMLDKEDICVKKDGSSTVFLVSKIPFLDKNNEIAGIIGMSIDVTDQKRKEEELRKLINVTSLQNKKLIDFAHIVSHNLRSHTANFSMLLDFLVHETNEDERSKILKMLSDSSDSLLETLNNLNEVVAINTNVNQEKKRVDLKKKVSRIEKDLQGFLVNHNAKIINNITEDLKIKVIPSYLDSILMNFITNAVKYSLPERRPIVHLSTRRKNGYTVLSIDDNGSGIDLKKYGEKLFGMYKTFHNHQDSRGIGLYISKNQIEAMKGKVEVESTVGVGTTFKIYFNEKD